MKKQPNLKQLYATILVGIIFHTAISFVLALIALFVWNVGVASLLHTVDTIGLMSSWAIMVGIYFVGMVFNFFYTKWLNTRMQIRAIEKMFGGKK